MENYMDKIYERLSNPEPPPEKGEKVVLKDAIDALVSRFVMGLDKYKTPLMTNNGRDALTDWYQEQIDSFMYATQYYLENRKSGG